MFMRRLSSSPLRVDLKLSPPCRRGRVKAGAALTIPALHAPSSSLNSGVFRTCGRSRSYNAWADCPMGDARRAPAVSIPSVDAAGRAEIFRALEASLGREFSSGTLTPSRRPLILVISGPSGAGKDAVITRLSEVREGLHFVVTATSRPKRPREIDGKDYHFMSKDQFISMVENDELLEYALVYGDYKGVPKQQIRDCMEKGLDIVLRVDIQGAETLRSIFRKSAVFIFIVAESEADLVERLIGRRTETAESLLIRAKTAREELAHVSKFDYVVTNTRGKLDEAVKRVESIIDAERAKVNQRDPLLFL